MVPYHLIIFANQLNQTLIVGLAIVEFHLRSQKALQVKLSRSPQETKKPFILMFRHVAQAGKQGSNGVFPL